MTFGKHSAQHPYIAEWQYAWLSQQAMFCRRHKIFNENLLTHRRKALEFAEKLITHSRWTAFRFGTCIRNDWSESDTRDVHDILNVLNRLIQEPQMVCSSTHQICKTRVKCSKQRSCLGSSVSLERIDRSTERCGSKRCQVCGLARHPFAAVSYTALQISNPILDSFITRNREQRLTINT